MDRSLVQAKQKRSGAGASDKIAQGTVKTVVHACRTGLVRHASGRLRSSPAPEQAQFRAGHVGRQPCRRQRVRAGMARQCRSDHCPDVAGLSARKRCDGRQSAEPAARPAVSQPASTTNDQKELQQVSNEETRRSRRAQAMAITGCEEGRRRRRARRLPRRLAARLPRRRPDARQQRRALARPSDARQSRRRRPPARRRLLRRRRPPRRRRPVRRRLPSRRPHARLVAARRRPPLRRCRKCRKTALASSMS